ncbi:MAG TPA: hypothetical protein DDW56_27390 [Cyanobacteria bacterium UBA11366]|nr:hypothetical protein [Cyanobacteria bacterium UBA11366]
MLKELGLPPVTKWRIPFFSRERVRGLAKELKKYQVNRDDDDDNDNLIGTFYLGEHIYFSISSIPKQKMLWDYHLHMFIKKHHTSKDVEDFISAAVELTHRLLDQTEVYWACLQRNENELESIPSVPIANRSRHLILTTKNQVEESYDSPDAFWNGGWSSIEEFGDKYLLTRCLKATEKISFLTQVLPHQWNMARGAKERLTGYRLPKLEPEEIEIFYADKPYLQVVGRDETEKYMKYACNLPPREHIAPWEIYKLRELVRNGKWEDGRRITGIHVVFPTQEMAEQEKRPLLDNRVRVFYTNDSGQEIEIISKCQPPEMHPPSELRIVFIPPASIDANSISSFLQYLQNHPEIPLLNLPDNLDTASEKILEEHDELIAFLQLKDGTKQPITIKTFLTPDNATGLILELGFNQITTKLIGEKSQKESHDWVKEVLITGAGMNNSSCSFIASEVQPNAFYQLKVVDGVLTLKYYPIIFWTSATFTGFRDLQREVHHIEPQPDGSKLFFEHRLPKSNW